MDTIEVLQQARALLARPKGWTRKSNARDAKGKAVNLDAPDAVSFCMTGAMRHVTPDFGSSLEYRDAFAAIQDTLVPTERDPYPVAWNDARGRKKTEVLAVMKATIDRLKEEANAACTCDNCESKRAGSLWVHRPKADCDCSACTEGESQ